MSDAVDNQQPGHGAGHRARIARFWRVIFIIYALGMTVGTHWPNLQLGPEIPASDKMIHLLSFGGLTLLLWRTQWIRHRLVVGLIVLAWSGLDELSQGFPGLNRTVSWHDLLANGLGVLVTTAWLWALRPVGVPGGANRLRLAVRSHIFDAVFARPRNWMLLAATGAACLLPLVLVWKMLGPADRGTPIFIAVVVGIVATSFTCLHLFNRERKKLRAQRPCLACGRPTRSISIDDAGMTACDSCGLRQHHAVWTDPVSPPAGIMLRISLWPALIAVLVLLTGFAIIFITVRVYSYMVAAMSQSGALHVAHMITSLPLPLVRAVDLSVYLLGMALVVWVYRRQLARFYDRGLLCLQCGHDLRGTPTTKGVGRCGECGAAFVRL